MPTKAYLYRSSCQEVFLENVLENVYTGISKGQVVSMRLYQKEIPALVFHCKFWKKYASELFHRTPLGCPFFLNLIESCM